MGSRGCFNCSFESVCFAYVSIQKIMSDCSFLNYEENLEFPKEVNDSADVFRALADCCINFVKNEDEESEEENKEFDDR